MPTEYLGDEDVEGVTVNKYRDYDKLDESTNHFILEVADLIEVHPDTKEHANEMMKNLKSAKGRKILKSIKAKRAELDRLKDELLNLVRASG